MEQKTMGKFLAALRKANGYTQRELAEKLNVSDKAVSRWERDENAPDLSLLPVLAEIYGVTIEELIRGERITEERNESRSREKTEKLYTHLREKALLKYRNKNLILLGIVCLGFLCTIGASRFFLRAGLGFSIGMICYLAVIIAELVITNEMLFTLDHMEEQREKNMQAKYHVILSAEKMITMAVVFMAVNASLVTGTKIVFDRRFFLKYGSLYAAIALIICVAFCYFGNEILLRKCVCEMEEKKRAIHRALFWKRPLLILSFAVIAGGTFLVHKNVAGTWNTEAVTEGIAMEQFADFREFMEQDASGNATGRSSAEDGSYRNTIEYGATTVTDAFGNYFEAGTGELQRIRDTNGKVIYSFYWNNTSVVKWEYSDNEKLLPITVYTIEGVQAAEKVVEDKLRGINTIFTILYIVELLAAAAVYWYWRQKKIWQKN